MSDSNAITYEWLLSINGITPKLAKALVYHFDVTGKECAAQFISYAGLNTNRKSFTKIQADNIVKRLGEDLEAISIVTGWPLNYLARYTNKDNLVDLITRSPYNKEVKLLMWKVGKALSDQDSEVSLYSRLYDERVRIEIEDKYESIEYAEAKALRYIEKIFLCHLFTQMYYSTNGKMPDRYNDTSKHNIDPEVPYVKV